jgi:hypothetical protein
MPELHIITGSNGARKSTIGPDYIPLHIRQQGPIFDRDKLFIEKRNEYWRSGIKSHKECKKLAWAYVEETFDAKVENALATNADFAYEGHLLMKLRGISLADFVRQDMLYILLF